MRLTLAVLAAALLAASAIAQVGSDAGAEGAAGPGAGAPGETLALPGGMFAGEIIIKNADHCRIDLVSRTWLLEGNVEIVQGSTWLWADTVTVHWSEEQRRVVAVELDGNVRARMLPPEPQAGSAADGAPAD